MTIETLATEYDNLIEALASAEDMDNNELITIALNSLNSFQENHQPEFQSIVDYYNQHKHTSK